MRQIWMAFITPKKKKQLYSLREQEEKNIFEPEWELIWTNLTRGNINNYFCIDTKRGTK